MKLSLITLSTVVILSLFFSCKDSQESITPATNDSSMVSVTNGYGSGKYKTEDTVHVFTSHYSDNQIFDKWTGDISLLNASDEWHTWFIMPDKNVNLTGSIKNITPFTLQFEQIKGKNRLKPVYSYFPTGHKGIVYLLHGTGGSASVLVSDYEFQILMRDLINNNLGVIITEAEESTTGVDSNGDGAIRWLSSPADTLTNIDNVNIRMITDVFYTRGTTSRSKLRYSIGMSNGGFYSASLSDIYKYKAAAGYCAQGYAFTMQTMQTPFQFCMARHDNNEGVGQAGNATALTNFNSLKARGVCSTYLIKERCPIYPERFARNGDLQTAQSVSVFNELKSKGYIDKKNYYVPFSDVLKNAYTTNPAGFPVLNSLTPSQRSFVFSQIDLSVSDHRMYSDFNRATIKFLTTQCQ